MDFYGDHLLAVKVLIDGQERVYVPVKPICDALGVEWHGQRQRIHRDDVLETTAFEITAVAADGKPREMLALPLDYLNGWLFGISANQVRPEVRERVLWYKRECYRVLYEAFQAKAQSPVSERQLPGDLHEERERLAQVVAVAQERIELIDIYEQHRVYVAEHIQAMRAIKLRQGTA